MPGERFEESEAESQRKSVRASPALIVPRIASTRHPLNPLAPPAPPPLHAPSLWEVLDGMLQEGVRGLGQEVEEEAGEAREEVGGCRGRRSAKRTKAGACVPSDCH